MTKNMKHYYSCNDSHPQDTHANGQYVLIQRVLFISWDKVSHYQFFDQCLNLIPFFLNKTKT